MPSKPTPESAVVITGTSTGIGRACALYLDERGYRVFAGYRNAGDAERLRDEASDRLVPVRLDVTDPGQIAEAVAAVATEIRPGTGLAGLVNNAGITVAGPLEFLPPDDVRRQFEVNVIGLVAVTQAFLPLIRRGHGRIVNIGSTSGFLVWPMLGAYGASKHAVEAVSDGFRRELRSSDISVSVVEPGSIATSIWGKTRAESDLLVDSLPPSARSLYSELIEATRHAVEEAEDRASPPSEVARVVHLALSAKRPRARYLVGDGAILEALIARLLPTRIADVVVDKLLRSLTSKTT